MKSTKLTRQELIKKVLEKDIEFFSKLLFEHGWTSLSRQPADINKFEKVWEINWGDGNEWTIALSFPEENVNIVLSGYYSSHGDSEFDEIGFGVPYEFKETRWKIASKDELRDLKLDEILNEN
jgi:hypothetical protein